MATSGGGPDSGTRAKDSGQGKGKVSPARNAAALVVLAAALGVLFVEVKANRSFATAVDKLEKATPSDNDADKASELLTMAQVEALIGKKPDGPAVPSGGEQKVTYTWNGLIKHYPLYAYFNTEKTPHLIHFSTEDVPAK
jgi:hypothetical protein